MATNAIVEIKKALTANEIKTRFREILGDKAPQFMASITNAVTGNPALQECDTNSIMAAAFIAASLDLPIDPNLGRAYIIPYKRGGQARAQFQIGYKGFTELAIRTGLYRDINVSEVYEDEIVEYNPILGRLNFVNDFTKCNQRDSGQTDKIVGYYANYELLSGTMKGLYMTKQQVINHAERYSQAYKAKKKDSPWFTNFDEMAKKTVLKRLLSKYAILSVEMQKAVVEDQKVYDEFGESEYSDNLPDNTPETEQAKLDISGIVSLPNKGDSATEKAIPVSEVKEAEEIVGNDFAQFEEQFIDAELPFR